MDIQLLHHQILKTGLTRYRMKNSKASLPSRVQAEKVDRHDKKGAIFAVRDKSHFLENKVKGFILTSREALHDNRSSISHWTPNVFRSFTYTDSTKQYIQGFSEENLLQVNTFVVDIDTKKHSREDILLACDESVGLPTLILESARGYQVYFVLDKPIYISNARNFCSLTVAKTISRNIKRSLASVDADYFCNDFGFFRLPTANNIIYYQPDCLYSVSKLISWSQRQSDDRNENPFFVVSSRSTTIDSVMQSDWLNALISATHIKGQKGRIGRNNTMFTLALLCLQDGWDIARTEDFLDTFNTSLVMPLKHSEVRNIVKSAFSGKYKGAAVEYIRMLLDEYVPNHTFEVKIGKSTWHKFKKAREDRQRSHYDELEQDLIDYLTAHSDVSEPFLWRTQNEICEALEMASSSLNILIKKSDKLLRTVIGLGRTKKTGWTTVALFKKHVLYSIQQAKIAYRVYLNELLQNDLIHCTDSPAAQTAVSFILRIMHQTGDKPLDISVANTS